MFNRTFSVMKIVCHVLYDTVDTSYWWQLNTESVVSVPVKPNCYLNLNSHVCLLATTLKTHSYIHIFKGHLLLH